MIYTDRRDFASECHRLQLERKVKVIDLARLLGRNSSVTSYYLSWRLRIPNDAAQKLADFFGLQVRLPLEH